MAKKLISYDDEAAGLGLPDVVEGRLDERFPTGQGLHPRPLQNVTVTDGAGTVRAAEVFDGYVWGALNGVIYRRPQVGGEWVAHANHPAGHAGLVRLFPTADGEAILASNYVLFKSSGWQSGTVTWEEKVVANGTTYFLEWGLDGDGQKFITTTYDAGTGFTHSRYAWISLDAGDTWTVAYDSVARYGQATADQSHIHGVAYDPWVDRFYLSEGHTSISGIYHSEDDGATWGRSPGMILDPSPTTLTPTDHGMVCGSDHERGGLYGAIRKDNPMDEELEWTWRWHPGRDALVGFAQRGFRCPDTGTVYVGFRSNFDDVKPVIAAGTPTSGALIYTWTPDITPPNPDDRARVRSVIVPTPTQLIARGNVGSNEGQEITAYIPPAGVLPDRDTGRIMGGTSTVGSSMAVGTQASTNQSDSIAIGIRAKSSDASTTAVGALASASGVHATAVGKSAAAFGPSVAFGSGASANVGGGSVAVGRGANAGGGETVVVGDLAVSGAISVVIGKGANSLTTSAAVIAIGHSAKSGSSGVAIGNGSNGFQTGVTIGRNSVTSGADAVALGYGASGGATSVIVGSGASSSTGAAGAVAVGYQATAVTSGVAIGRGAKSDHIGSIALGRDTTTTRHDQVAYGARHVEAAATTAPPTPAAGKYRQWSEVDDTTGKMRLMVAFPTGTPIVIAQEA
jgi:hypothetical protein